jgi:hypothetical protein
MSAFQSRLDIFPYAINDLPKNLYDGEANVIKSTLAAIEQYHNQPIIMEHNLKHVLCGTSTVSPFYAFSCAGMGFWTASLNKQGMTAVDAFIPEQRYALAGDGYNAIPYELRPGYKQHAENEHDVSQWNPQLTTQLTA